MTSDLPRDVLGVANCKGGQLLPLALDNYAKEYKHIEVRSSPNFYLCFSYEPTAWQDAAISCYIAGGMYAVIGVVSYWQKVVNDRYLALEPETTSIMF